MNEMIRVKFLMLGQESVILDVPAGSTVADVLSAAGVPSTGLKVSVNGRDDTSMAERVSNGQTIVATNKVAGG